MSRNYKVTLKELRPLQIGVSAANREKRLAITYFDDEKEAEDFLIKFSPPRRDKSYKLEIHEISAPRLIRERFMCTPEGENPSLKSK